MVKKLLKNEYVTKLTTLRYSAVNKPKPIPVSKFFAQRWEYN